MHVFPSVLYILAKDKNCIKKLSESVEDFLHSDILQSEDSGNNGKFCLDTKAFPFP